MLQRFGRRFGQKGSTRYVGAPCASVAWAAAFACGRARIVMASASKQTAKPSAKIRFRLFRVSKRFVFMDVPRMRRQASRAFQKFLEADFSSSYSGKWR